MSARPNVVSRFCYLDNWFITTKFLVITVQTMEFFRQPGSLLLDCGKLESEWKQKFENCLLAIGITEKPVVSSWRHSYMSLAMKAFLCTTPFVLLMMKVRNWKDGRKYEKMKRCLLHRKNEVYERFLLCQFQQAFGESIDAFITKLRTFGKIRT